ncbi:MAG: ThiF family adenylyltransferase [Phycisphaerales bacterium]
MNGDERYHRQMLLPQIGEAGQDRLRGSRVLLVGCGALGCPVADLLVRAGVGRITIVDRDVVERTNLQRQTLFDEADAIAGRSKAEAAAARLRRVNSRVIVDAVVADFSPRNAEPLLEGAPDAVVGSDAPTAPDAARSRPARRADVLVDGTDNFLTRYLLNDLAVKHGVPLVYGGAVGAAGMSMTIIPGRTPCLRCVFPDAPAPSGPLHATCDTAGILAPVSTLIGAVQAIEVIKLLVGNADAASADLAEFDLWHNRARRFSVVALRSDSCECCVQRNFPFLGGRYDSDVRVICTRHAGGAVQVVPPRRAGMGAGASDAPGGVHLPTLAQRLRSQGRFDATPSALRGYLDHESGEGMHGIELTVFSDGRAIIRGTTDTGVARSIYARYVGE